MIDSSDFSFLQSKMTSFDTNPQLKPTFLKDTVVTLTKDYTELDPVLNEYLEKGTPGRVVECGLSMYGFNKETQEFSILIDNEEWCALELPPTEMDHDNTDGWVKAKDLKEFTIEDLELD